MSEVSYSIAYLNRFWWIVKRENGQEKILDYHFAGAAGRREAEATARHLERQHARRAVREGERA
jgi:hypothetical protein